MKSQSLVRVILITVLLILPSMVRASENNNQTQTQVNLTENRMLKRFGAYLGILGDPHPTLVGFNVAYNVNDYLRASVGFGKVTVSSIDLTGSSGITDTSLTTIGAAAKFLMPGWNLSPSATLGYSHIAFDGVLADNDYKSSNLYFGVGGDWQAASGFNLGAGLNVSINGGAPTAPYMNVGMFF